jgi:signal peptide peptidase SppA
MKTGFLSLFTDALAIHEPALQQTLREYAQNPKSREDREQAGWDEEWPSTDDLIQGNGVALIPVHGMMIKRSRWWCCGVDHWSDVVDNITNRLDINTIVLDLDSGGGQVAGTERFADAVWKARQSGKTVIAAVNEFCASAALWVASQCDRIVIPATGSIGSLGVYTMHFDDTKFLSEQWGIEKSVIHRGKYKAIDERPLDGDGKAELQRFIDGKYSLFVDAVARGRGLSPEEVMSKWGESQMFTGSEAVSNGLADELGTLQDVLESLRAGRNGRISIAEESPEDNEGEPNAMKLNAQGQILDAAGKVVGSLSDLGLDSASVQKHFAAQTRELIDSAAESINIAAFKAGDDVVKAKASIADDLAAQLKAKDEEIAKLKEAAAAPKGPKFSASDAGQSSGKKSENAEDPDAEYADEFAKSGEGFPSLKAFAAFKRYKDRAAAKA